MRPTAFPLPALVLALLAGFAGLAPAPLAAQAAAPKPRSTLALRHSRGFSVDYYEGWKLVTVSSPWPGSKASFRYALYPRGASLPAEARAFPDARPLAIPLRRVATFSTTYLAPIVVLGEAGSVVGVDSADFVSSPEIRARLEAGLAAETTRNWMPDVERLIALAPDAVFIYGMGNEWDNHPKLLEAGLPVVMNGEWNEAEPLARAEWIKFIAAFYDKEARAAAHFDRVEAEYLRIKALAAASPGRKPAVLVNGPFQGSWTVAGGASFMARFIADSGGRYLWEGDRGTGGLVLSIEAVWERALGADVWLSPGAGVATLSALAAQDPRFASIPALVKGEVWNNDARLNGRGGNDWFESAAINPDLVLVDLVKILRPGLLADRPFTYFRKLGR